MKRLLFLSFVMSSVISLNAQLFQQDFSASTTVADYISATPNSGQFEAMSPDGATLTNSITNGALRISRTGSAAIYAYRNFTLANNPTFVQLKFDFEASNLGTITNPLLAVIVGNTFTSASTGATSNFASRFGFKAGTTAGYLRAYSIDNIDGSPQTAEFTGRQTITFIINNSGVEQTYTAPDASQEIVAAAKMDLWIGTTRGINDFSLKNIDAVKGAISGFKIQSGLSTSGTGDFDFDNIEFKDLLPISTRNSIVKSINNLYVYPNPVAGISEIRNLPLSIESVKLNLYNISSQLIESKLYSVSNGVVIMDMHDIAQGTYFITGNAGEPFALKLIKK